MEIQMANYYLICNFIIFCINILCINSACVKNGYVGEANGIACQVIDHKYLKDQIESSFDCITEIENSIVVHKDGDITLECFAKFPFDLDYDGVVPAVNFQVKFHKSDPSLETISQKLSDTYVMSIRLKGSIWSANYIFHPINNMKDTLMMSVFFNKEYLPFFLPLADETIIAYFNPLIDKVVLPCRVQNYDCQPTLFKDFEPVDKDIITFDPRKGFLRTIDEDDDPYGEYECYCDMNRQEDRQKVLYQDPTTVSTEHPEPIPQLDSKEYGQLKFIKTDDDKSMAMCRFTKPKHHKPSATTFANSEYNNAITFKLKRKCLHDMDPKIGRMCPGRIIGKHVNISGIPHESSTSTPSSMSHSIATLAPSLSKTIKKLFPFDDITDEDEIYEINPIHPNGGIKCGYNRMEYFTGTDHNIYFDYKIAHEKNALVTIEPIEHYTKFFTNGWYGFDCKFTSYISVLPVWWVLIFSNGTKKEEFASNSTIKYYELTNDVTQLSCRVSAWNSSEWFESNFTITVSEPDVIETHEHYTQIYFKSNVQNQVLPCKATGKPKPILKWLKNGQEDNTLSTSTDGDTLLLAFPNVTKNDEGNYTCAIQSSTATIEVKFSISVEEENQSLDELVVLKPKDDEPVKSCVSIPTLYKSGTTEEIKDASLIKTGDSIFVRISPNCSKDDLVAINFTASVGRLGDDDNSKLPSDDLAAPIPEDEDNKLCASIPTLYKSGTREEIKDASLIKTGDSILVQVSPNCSQDGLVTINFTASVATIGEDVNSDLFPVIPTTGSSSVRIGQQCSLTTSFYSAENGEKIEPKSIQEGDSITIRISEQNCSDKGHNNINLTVSVNEFENKGNPIVPELLEKDEEEPWYYSTTAVSLALIFICLLIVLLLFCCAYYCIGRPSKVYHVNR